MYFLIYLDFDDKISVTMFFILKFNKEMENVTKVLSHPHKLFGHDRVR